MKSTNSVAKILKIYGWLNGIACIILGIILYNNLPGTFDYLWIVEVSAGILFSFLLYACGEAIQLLQDIRNNTGCSKGSESLGDILREIRSQTRKDETEKVLTQVRDLLLDNQKDRFSDTFNSRPGNIIGADLPDL